MKVYKYSIVIIGIVVLIAQTCFSQDTMNNPMLKPNDETIPFNNSWGADVLFSTNGFGLGTFFRHEYTQDIAGFIDFSISESKDEREIEYYDYYSGTTYVLGKTNRFLVMPLYAGVQYRMFREEILDNFRPYINAAVGPTMIYVFPYNEEYFSALGKGHPQYTVGGYIGFGAFFGSERSSLLGLNIRYYIVPVSGGIESMQMNDQKAFKSDFGGLFISLNLGNAW